MDLKKNPLTDEAASAIEALGLMPHPEGGWYREVYRSEDMLQAAQLPERYSQHHCFSTSIYYLLEKGQFSTFHRLKSDETWHFYIGNPVEIFIIPPDGSLMKVLLGNNISDGQSLQFTIRRNCWFAALPTGNNPFSLVGCTVSPGFEFADFEIADRKDLIDKYPAIFQIITLLTR